MDTAFILAERRRRECDASRERRVEGETRRVVETLSPVERVSGSGFRTTRVTGLKVFSTVFKHFSKTRISKFPRFLSSAASSRSPATITGFGTGTTLSLSLALSLSRFEEGEAV